MTSRAGRRAGLVGLIVLAVVAGVLLFRELRGNFDPQEQPVPRTTTQESTGSPRQRAPKLSTTPARPRGSDRPLLPPRSRDEDTALAAAPSRPGVLKNATPARPLDSHERLARNEVELARAVRELAESVYPPDGTFPVSLEEAEVGAVFLVHSQCDAVPDYYLATLFLGEYLAGLVVLDKVDNEIVRLAMVNPVGPAYIGPDSVEPHGLVRGTSFPPVPVEVATELVGPRSEYQGLVYVCPEQPLPQTNAFHLFQDGRNENLVSILDGEVVSLVR